MEDRLAPFTGSSGFFDKRRGSLESGRLFPPRHEPLERRGSLPPPARRTSLRAERRGSADTLPATGGGGGGGGGGRFDSSVLGDLVHCSYTEEFDFAHYLQEEALLEERSRRGLYPILEGVGRPSDVSLNIDDSEALELELKKGAPVAVVVDDGEHVVRETVETPTPGLDSDSRDLLVDEESGEETEYAYDNEGYDRL